MLSSTLSEIALAGGTAVKPHSALFFGNAEESYTSARVADLLRRHFDIRFCQHFSFDDQKNFNQDEFIQYQADFLFSFGPMVVRKPLLDSIKVAAINFYPAPPERTRRDHSNLALSSGDNEFGVTAHLMNSQSDYGAILRVMRFPITNNDDAESLRSKAFAHVPHLAWQIIGDLTRNNWQPKPCGIEWETETRQQEEIA